MRANIGMLDRTLRIVVGLILLSLVFVGPKTLWGLVGLLPLFDGPCALLPGLQRRGR